MKNFFRKFSILWKSKRKYAEVTGDIPKNFKKKNWETIDDNLRNTQCQFKKTAVKVRIARRKDEKRWKKI